MIPTTHCLLSASYTQVQNLNSICFRSVKKSQHIVIITCCPNVADFGRLTSTTPTSPITNYWGSFPNNGPKLHQESLSRPASQLDSQVFLSDLQAMLWLCLGHIFYLGPSHLYSGNKYARKLQTTVGFCSKIGNDPIFSCKSARPDTRSFKIVDFKKHKSIPVTLDARQLYCSSTMPLVCSSIFRPVSSPEAKSFQRQQRRSLKKF